MGIESRMGTVASGSAPRQTTRDTLGRVIYGGKILPPKQVVVVSLYESNLLTPMQFQEAITSGMVTPKNAPGNRTSIDPSHLIDYLTRSGKPSMVDEILRKTYVRTKNGHYK